MPVQRQKGLRGKPSLQAAPIPWARHQMLLRLRGLLGSKAKIYLHQPFHDGGRQVEKENLEAPVIVLPIGGALIKSRNLDLDRDLPGSGDGRRATLQPRLDGGRANNDGPSEKALGFVGSRKGSLRSYKRNSIVSFT